MSTSETVESVEKRGPGAGLPSGKWWGHYVAGGESAQPRFVLHWGRILSGLVVAGLMVYLALATVLWGYFSFYRKIPGVSWVDVAVLPRFHRVHQAIGDYYFSEAKRLWQQGSYAQSVMTGRAAVLKNPRKLESRLFLADCWILAGRPDEAIRMLKEGLEYQPGDRGLQMKLVAACQAAGRSRDLLKILRSDFPAHGVRVLNERVFQIAEVEASLDVEGPDSAQALASGYAGFEQDPVAAPTLAKIDWDQNQPEKAFSRLGVARAQAPDNPSVYEAYVEAALRTKNGEEARTASEGFLRAFPNQYLAHLMYLQARGSRKDADLKPWLTEYARVIAQYRESPQALAQLASVAASEGWSDVTWLLYQNSLQEKMTGFPFAVYHVAALVKSKNYAAAESVWRELSVKNSAQTMSATHLEALVLYGVGRESEALQAVDRLRRDTENAPERRRMLARIFRNFGFEKLALQLVAPAAAPAQTPD